MASHKITLVSEEFSNTDELTLTVNAPDKRQACIAAVAQIRALNTKQAYRLHDKHRVDLNEAGE